MSIRETRLQAITPTHNLLSNKDDATTAVADTSSNGGTNSGLPFGNNHFFVEETTLPHSPTSAAHSAAFTAMDATVGSSSTGSGSPSLTTSSAMTMNASVGTNANWYLSLANSTLRADVTADVAGGTITYTEMLTLLNVVVANGTVTASEFNDLKLIAANLNDGITTSSYVTNITNKLIGGDPANAYWNGGSNTAVALGNVAAGTTATQLSELIGKWFLGTDMPAIGSQPSYIANPHYVTCTTPLYGSSGAPSMNDINQGYLGDCYFLASLAEVAALEPSTIASMIQSDGNGVYGVRFYINGAADWVTVNSALPESSGIVYTNNMLFNQTTANLWADLVEKAYAELNASGVLPRPAGNSYAAIAGGWGDPITELTNKPMNYYNVTSSVSAQNTLKQNMVAALSQNNEIWLGSFAQMFDSSGKLTFESSHAYSVIGYDSKTGNFVIRNPWGTMAGQYWDTTFEASMADLYKDQAYIGIATGSSPTVAPTVTAISETAASADLNAGKTVTLTLTLSSAVNVTGAPTLTLNDGGVATFASGSGTNSLTFSYTVLAGQNTSALTITAINLPSGATIQTAGGLTANLSLTGLMQSGPQIDTLAPGAPVIASGAILCNVVTLNGTAEANSIVTVRDGSTVLGTTTSNSSGAWTFKTGALANGVNTFTATATDQAGNVSAASTAFNQTINYILAAPTISGDAVNANVVTLTGKAAANDTVTVYDGATKLGTTTSNSSGAWTYTTGVLANGVNAFTAKVTDAVGNISAASTVFNQTINYTPPAPTISGDTVNANVVTLTGKAAANDTVTVYDGATKLGATTANSSGAWSYTTGNLANGLNAFTARAADAAGNLSAVSNTFNQTISYTPPKVSAVSASGAGITNGKGDVGFAKVVTITLTMTGAVVVTGAPTLTLNDGGVATYAGGSGTNTLSFSYTVLSGQSTSALAVAAMNLANGATVKDAVGNAATLTGAVTTFTGLQIDGIKPNAPVITNATATTNAIATLTGTAEAGSTLTVYDGTTKLGTTTVNSNGAWTFVTAKLGTAVHNFTATATDMAGNVGAASSNLIEVAVGTQTLYGQTGVASLLVGTGSNNGFVVYNTVDKVTQLANNNFSSILALCNYTLPTNVDSLTIINNASQGTGNNDSINYLYDESSVASTLTAGSGTDMLCVLTTACVTLVGGSGRDTFDFAYNVTGKDTVTNFHTNKDVLQFNTSLFANFAAAMSHASQVGANTVITIDSHDSITLQNVNKTSLTANNFHFA